MGNIAFLLVLAGAAALFIYLRRPPVYTAEGELYVHYIDVGQGDCTLITAGREAMLIDSGEYTEVGSVENYLEKYGISCLDVIVCTHPHSDHMGGMADIIERFDVGEIYIPHVKREKIPTAVYYDKFLDAVNRKRVKLSEVSAGESFTVGDGHCTVVAPCSDDYEGLNDYSIGILMRHGKKSFLFTGDAEEASETEMILSGRLSSVDVYKAGHHGSSSSSTEGFLAVIRPEYAVISCGRDNPYGHPSDQVIKRLQRYTKNIFRTDLCGDIIICSDGEEISVRTERDEII